MNHPPVPLGLFGVLSCHLLVAGVGLAEERASCAEVARKIQRAVSARPERVLIVIEDALVVDETCACEVTKGAIVASKAKPRLVGQIVFTAVTASPQNAPLIAECAASISPDASGEIKAALAKALGGVDASATVPAAPPREVSSDSAPAEAAAGETPAAGKNPAADNNPPASPPRTPTVDFGFSPLAIGGVFLVYPGGGGSPVAVEKDLTQTTRRLVRSPRVIVIRPPTTTFSNQPPGP